MQFPVNKSSFYILGILSNDSISSIHVGSDPSPCHRSMGSQLKFGTQKHQHRLGGNSKALWTTEKSPGMFGHSTFLLICLSSLVGAFLRTRPLCHAIYTKSRRNRAHPDPFCRQCFGFAHAETLPQARKAKIGPHGQGRMRQLYTPGPKPT